MIYQKFCLCPFQNWESRYIGKLHRSLLHFFVINTISYLRGNLRKWWNEKCTITCKTMCKSLHIFHIAIQKNVNLKKINLFLITVDNVKFVIYNRYKYFLLEDETQKQWNFIFHADSCLIFRIAFPNSLLPT